MKFKDMIRKLLIFLLFYILVPVVIIPFLCLKFGSPYGLFGSFFYYVGLIIAKFKQWIFLPIPIIFCLWYWYTYGFGIRDYVSIYFACMMTAVLLQQAFATYSKFVNKILPEQELNLEYDAKVEEMNQQIALYKQNHPMEKISQEVIEKIRTDIFFRK